MSGSQRKYLLERYAVQVQPQHLRRLPLSEAVEETILAGLERFPPLVMDQCLSSSQNVLIEWVVSSFSGGRAVASETLTIPRRGFGPRPVTLASTPDRALYLALVKSLQGDLLPRDARSPEAWTRHEAFGLPDSQTTPSHYVVEMDIASCYEYIEHDKLFEELTVRTSEIASIEYITAFLGELFGKSRGLPQLSPASDVLADVYLEVIERDLLRSGYSVSRVADDMKVIGNEWGQATEVIEQVAETARSLGLVLSTEKTRINKASKLSERAQARAQFILKYFAEAKEASKLVSFLAPYGDPDVEVEIEQEELIRATFMRILKDWYEAQGTDEDTSPHAQFVSRALSPLATSTDRIPDEWLTELVFRKPLHLRDVCRYVEARSECGDNWRTLRRLVEMPRQGPWAKIWLLHTADRLKTAEGGEHVGIIEAWAKAQLSNRHETVRSESAWFLAGRRKLDERDLAEAYRSASSLTRSALAATCGRMMPTESSGLAKAIRRDSRLNVVAFDWARQNE